MPPKKSAKASHQHVTLTIREFQQLANSSLMNNSCGVVLGNRARAAFSAELRRPANGCAIMIADAIDEVESTERTGDRIRAYLASMQMRDGNTADLNAYRRGEEAIRRLAEGVDGYEPAEDLRRLSSAECAAILRFMADSEPVSSADWWSDPDDAPSHVCGLQFVLGAIRASIER